MKNVWSDSIRVTAVVLALGLAGCGGTENRADDEGESSSTQVKPETGDALESQTATGADNILGGTDADGFVRLPGEPSRGDDAYYVTGQLCQQFTREFMEGILGRAILKAEPSHAELTNCRYDLGEPNTYGVAPNVLLSLSFLSVEGQIKGHEAMDRAVASEPSIPMENHIVKQENGLINEIYLVLGPNKFLSINRGPGAAVTEKEVLDLAIRLGEKLKAFK